MIRASMPGWLRWICNSRPLPGCAGNDTSSYIGGEISRIGIAEDEGVSTVSERRMRYLLRITSGAP